MKTNQRKAGVVLSYLSQAIMILSGLIYTPVMLRLLGKSEYGLYQLVNSVVSYLGLLSMGFTGSYIRFYAREKVQDDNKAIARLNGMFMTIFLVISLITVICGIVMVYNVKGIFGNRLTAAELSKSKILMSLMVFNLALSFPNSMFDCCITAHEQFVFQRLVTVMQNLLNPFIALPLLLMGFGSVGMVSVSTFLAVASFTVNIIYCFKYLKVRFIFKGFRFSFLKDVWIFTFFIFLNQIIDQINWSVDKFLLGRFAGTSAVAIYGVGSQINSMYLQFSTSISGVFTPKVNKIAIEANNNSELTQLFIRVGRVQFVILSLILSGFFIFGKSFIDIWAGKDYSVAYYVTLFLIAPVTVPLIQNLGIEIQRAKNMHKARSVVYFFIAIFNILLSIPMTKMYGPIGAAIGTAISLTIGNIFFMNWYYHKKIGLDMISFWKNISKFIPALILPLVLGMGIHCFIKPKRITQIVLWGILYCAIYGICMLKFGLNEEEKSLVNAVVLKFRKKK